MAIWQNWCFGKFYYSGIDEFETWQFGKISVLVNFIIQELKFCKTSKHSFVSVSLVRDNLIELRESLKHKIRT